MCFIDDYINESNFFIGEDENGLPREDELQDVLEQIDDDIDSLDELKSALNSAWYTPEEIKKHLIDKGIWKDKNK